MSSEPRLDQPDADTSPLTQYPFEVGDRVVGPGVNGKIVERPGPYSVTVMQEPSRFRLSASISGLTKKG